MALWMTRSAPRASGFWLMGVAKVLSASTTAPASCPAFASRSMSITLSVGFVGVSRYSRSQPRATAASICSWSVVSMSSTETPMCGRKSTNIWLVPPYVSFTETTRSPGLSSAKRLLLMAAMPVAKLVAASPPSSTRTFSSNACVVGLVLRL